MEELQKNLLEAFYQFTLNNYAAALPLFVSCMQQAENSGEKELFNQAFHGWNNAWIAYQQQQALFRQKLENIANRQFD